MFARPPSQMHNNPFDPRPSLDPYMSPLPSPPSRRARNPFYGNGNLASRSIGGSPQYAFPIQRQHRSGVERSEGSLGGSLEHSLRRKTPNGTIPAGYDATPVDNATQLPAQKHVLVSSLPESSSIASSRSIVAPESSWQRQQADLGNNTMDHLSRTFSRQNYGINSGLANTVAHGGFSGNNQFHITYPFGMDSVLDQTIPVHHSPRYYMENNSTVPTVLPASYLAFTRPTASAGSGLYGPYWPDGAFAPYRPAPFRDLRFYPSLAYDRAHGTSDGTIGRSFSSRANAGGYAAPNASSFDQNQPGYPYLQPYSNSIQVAQSDPFYSPEGNFRGSHVQRAHLSRGPNADYGTSIHDVDYRTEAQRDAYDFYQSSNTRPSSAEYREKTLAWAHRVYVDLLATIHQSRRNGMHKQDGSRHASKPNIFPKPPRQPGSDFSGQSRPSRSPSRKQEHVSSLNDTTLVVRPSGASDIPSRPTTAIFSPSNRYQNHSRADWQFGQPTRPLPSFSDHYAERYRTSRKSSASGLLPMTRTTPTDPVTVENSAKAALDTLDELCQGCNWDWVDGLLLSGCLAYGLADYNKAMTLYQRILEKDNDNVEAMSNLAATLLALNRREEALNYWLRAVKLRPSYFEAVEHLIGLLNSGNRSREAINVIQYVEDNLRFNKPGRFLVTNDQGSDGESDTKSSWSASTGESSDTMAFDYDERDDDKVYDRHQEDRAPGFGSSGFAIPGSDNGRMLALIHAKGNMLYSQGENQAAAAAFEEAILIAAGRPRRRVKGIIKNILKAFTVVRHLGTKVEISKDPILLYPEKALQTAKMIFPTDGSLPGLEFVVQGMSRKAAVSTASNSLLSLAKIYQDSMPNVSSQISGQTVSPVRDILALYYLSLSLQPSPSTANNVGILLATVQQSAPVPQAHAQASPSARQVPEFAGVVPGSGIALAFAYYNYGLNLDPKHAHLYTNLGSLLKDLGQLPSAVRMYEYAVQCDGNFDIALANLANAVKDQGRVNDAIMYYRRAVKANPDFAEAVCGLATALNTICGWTGRGGIYADGGERDRWHVDDDNALSKAAASPNGFGWMKRVVDIVEKQLKDGALWGRGTLSNPSVAENLLQQITVVDRSPELREQLQKALREWSNGRWEGSRIVRLIERANRRLTWHWYHDQYTHRKSHSISRYNRPQIPSNLSTPNAPTLLPFYTFTNPLSHKQIRQISARNGLRISVSTLRASWIPQTVYPPPRPPAPSLRVGYVSSDFNNHPLAHLMQSVFGLHDISRVTAYCYATTASDNSTHRKQIEEEAPHFHDTHTWSTERLVNQIIQDGIHILVNLNGYTRGARNEVFAARPAPIQMSFMGFAGSLGAEWCDYLLADQHTIPLETLSPCRRNADLGDKLRPNAHAEDDEDWVYVENVIFTRDTFFCCDHKQSAPNVEEERNLTWHEEQEKRWRMRKEIFPRTSDDAIILGNFNQLYKIDPTTLRLYLRILTKLPNAILWLLRFPDIGEQNILTFAKRWSTQEVADRIIFTDVAPKGQHISRARIVDLFLDTPECNAHTTSADVVWSGTPVLTWGRRQGKMCSRMAGSIVSSALPVGPDGDVARKELVKDSEEAYEAEAIRLAKGLQYVRGGNGLASGRLTELRKMLWEGRWNSRLFDTKRWVREVERGYWAVWTKWVQGEGGDVFL